MERLPEDAAASRAIRERALAHPTVAESLLGAGGRATAVVVELHRSDNGFEGKQRMTEALRSAMEAEGRPGVDLVLAGTPPLDTAFLAYSKRDSRLLGPLAVLVVLAAMYLVFRRLSRSCRSPLVDARKVHRRTPGLLLTLGSTELLSMAREVPRGITVRPAWEWTLEPP